MSTSSRSRVVEALQRAASEVVGPECDLAMLNQSLADLAIDSLALIEMSISVEDDLGIELQLEDFEGVTTVEDVVVVIERVLVSDAA